MGRAVINFPAVENFTYRSRKKTKVQKQEKKKRDYS